MSKQTRNEMKYLGLDSLDLTSDRIKYALEMERSERSGARWAFVIFATLALVVGILAL